MLSEGRRQRSGSTVEFNAGDITNFLLLNAVNTFLPVVNHMVEHLDMPPETAYLLLSQFAGQLCSFVADGSNTNADPTTLPKFLYTDLGMTFEELFNRINALLNIAIREKFIVVPLETRPDGLHFGRLEDDRLPRSKLYILTVASTNIPEQTVAQQLPALSKIASWTQVGDIVVSAVVGVPLQVTYKPPPEIPIKQGLVYFQLDTEHQYWKAIAQERTVAIYLPPPFDPTNIKIQLLAVPAPER